MSGLCRMPDRPTDITGVILVGGRSRRLGRDKALVEFGGRPLFERVLALFRDRFDRVLLVGGRGERFAAYGVPVIEDLYPGSALGGLYTGLFRCATEYAFVSPCDLPYPSGALVDHLCAMRRGADAVVPVWRNCFETLFALYGRNCLDPMRRLLASGNLRVYDLYPQIRVRYVAGEELDQLAPGGRAFVNINTPEEYERLEKGRT